MLSPSPSWCGGRPGAGCLSRQEPSPPASSFACGDALCAVRSSFRSCVVGPIRSSFFFHPRPRPRRVVARASSMHQDVAAVCGPQAPTAQAARAMLASGQPINGGTCLLPRTHPAPTSPWTDRAHAGKNRQRGGRRKPRKLYAAARSRLPPIPSLAEASLPRHPPPTAAKQGADGCVTPAVYMASRVREAVHPPPRHRPPGGPLDRAGSRTPTHPPIHPSK